MTLPEVERSRTVSTWGRPYGCTDDHPSYLSEEHGRLWMHRRGQRVRFFDVDGVQVGPEQSNVGPGVAYAWSAGWIAPDMIHLLPQIAAERARGARL